MHAHGTTMFPKCTRTSRWCTPVICTVTQAASRLFCTTASLGLANTAVRSPIDSMMSPIDGVPDDPADSIAQAIYFLHDKQTRHVSLVEALRCLRAYSLLPAPQTLELSINVNMRLKKSKRRDPFRGTLVYPNRFGEERKVLLIAEDEVLAEAKCADLSGGGDMITQLEKKSQELEFDICVCTPHMYENMKHLQKVLRTKMPNPRRGTVVPPEEISQSILTFQRSKTFKCSKYGAINMAVGMIDFEDSEVEANIKCLIQHLSEQRGTMAMDIFLRRATLTSSFGPGFVLTLQDLL